MKIKIANLSFGHHTMNFRGKVGELHLPEPFLGEFILGVEIEKSVHQLVLHACVEVNAQLICDRCSIDYIKPLKFDYDMVYLYKQPVADFDDPNVIYITPDTDTIDISKDIYDYAMLAIPLKNLCKEECKGLCLKCGTDLNLQDCSCDKTAEESTSPFAQLKKMLNSN